MTQVIKMMDAPRRR